MKNIFLKLQLSLFAKITTVTVLFALLTYFISTALSDIQYNQQDAMYDYQNLVLYQNLADDWNPFSNNGAAYTLDTLQIGAIKKDLENLHLSLFVALYEDRFINQEIDLEYDSLLISWYSEPNQSFNVNDYVSHGDLNFLADSILKIMKHNNYASYGEYGTTAIPATFIEKKISKKYIEGYWLISNHPLPADIQWPEIILTIAIILILFLNFLIIRGFLRPIKLIKAHVQGLKHGNLSSQIKIQSEDELGLLSKTINKMTLDISRLVNQKQNLLIDVSHELKTPLTRLKLIVANMKIEEPQKKQINKEINFLQDMISNMLLSDKLSTPYIEDLAKKSILVHDLIQHACDMFYEVEKKLIIINKTKKTEKINVDNYKMSLAIKNLIDNAVKYGHPDKKSELMIKKEKGSIIISVEDFGRGISAAQLSKVEKPLYRGQGAKEKNKTGFGLGLAITKKIIEAHKGHLKIVSTVKKGSKFIITIPEKEQKQ